MECQNDTLNHYEKINIKMTMLIIFDIFHYIYILYNWNLIDT